MVYNAFNSETFVLVFFSLFPVFFLFLFYSLLLFIYILIFACTQTNTNTCSKTLCRIMCSFHNPRSLLKLVAINRFIGTVCVCVCLSSSCLSVCHTHKFTRKPVSMLLVVTDAASAAASADIGVVLHKDAIHTPNINRLRIQAHWFTIFYMKTLTCDSVLLYWEIIENYAGAKIVMPGITQRAKWIHTHWERESKCFIFRSGVSLHVIIFYEAPDFVDRVDVLIVNISLCECNIEKQRMVRQKKQST